MKTQGNHVIGNLQQTSSYLVDVGSVDAYAVTFLPPITPGYTNGLGVVFLAANANTGPCTLEVDGYGPVPIVKNVTQALGDSDILAGEIVYVVYDGTYFQMMDNPSALLSPFSTFLIDGGEVVWVANYDYNVSIADYVILGTQYMSPETPITLATADPLQNRLDLVVADTNNSIQVITGVPADNPLEPAYDPATQIPLQFILVEAGTTQPSCGLLTTVYKENLGTPTEWATTSSSGTMVVNSTSNPRTGTKDIEGTAVPSGVALTFTPASPFDSTVFTQLDLYIRSKGSWGTTANGHRISVTFYNSVTQLGIAAIIPPRGAFGFDSSTTGSYQQVVLNSGLFNIPVGSLITSMKFTIEGVDGSMGWYIDDVSIETGCTIPASPNPLLFVNGLTKNGSTVRFGGALNQNTILNTGSFVQTFSLATIYNYGYQFEALQSFENGTAITSFRHKGSLDTGAADFFNTIRLGINYTSNVYNAFPTDLVGYMNDKIGYWLGTNLTSTGSFGLYTDDANSKSGGIFFHTLDTSYTDVITIFGKHPPTADGDISIQPGNTGLEPYRLVTFHDDGAATLWKYGVGSFADTPAYALGVTASGQVIEYAPGGGSLDRFAISGEDDTATQNRVFNANGFPFQVNDSSGTTLTSSSGGDINSLIITPTTVFLGDAIGNRLDLTTSSFEAFIQASDGFGNAYLDLHSDTVGSNALFDLHVNGATTVSVLGDATAGLLTLSALNGLVFTNYGSGTFTGTPTYNLSVDASGNVIETTISGGSTRFGVSGEDNVAGEDRQFNFGATHFFDFIGSRNNYLINATQSGTGNALEGVSLSIGAGVVGQSASGLGVWAQSNSGIALFAQSGSSGGDGFPTARLVADNSVVDSVINVLEIQRTTSGTAAVGIGGSVSYSLEQDGGGTVISNELSSILSDATAGLENSQFNITGVLAGVATGTLLSLSGLDSYIQANDGTSNAFAEVSADSTGSPYFELGVNTPGYSLDLRADSSTGKMTFTAPTGLVFTGYGSGTFINTPAYGIGVDASGNVIEYTPLITQSRFGFSGEDDTAGEHRTFDATGDSTYGLTINGIVGLFDDPLLKLDNTGDGATLDVRAVNGSGCNIQATGTGIALNTTSDSNIAVTATSSTNRAFQGFSGAGPVIELQVSNATTSSLEKTVVFVRNSTGAGANGIGQYVDFVLKTSTTTRSANQIISKYIDATDASRTSELSFAGENNAGGMFTLFIIKGDGTINIPTNVQDFANNAAAITGGLVAGDIYRNGDVMQIVH